MCNKCSGKCNSCECNCKTKKPCGDPCADQDCGCDFLVATDCIVTEENYDCIDSVKGEKLKEVLAKIDKKLCDKSQAEDGEDGDSAYQIWLNLGNQGTEQDFLDSLVPECECEEQQEVYLYELEKVPDNQIGTWQSRNIGEEIGITPTNFSYTIPTGQGGVYDIEFQCTVKNLKTTNSFVAGFFVGNIAIPYGSTAATTAETPTGVIPIDIPAYQNIYLVKNNVALLAGDIVNLKLAMFEAKGEFIKNKFRIIKR